MDIDNLSKKIEQVSQSYAAEFNIKRDKEWFILKLQEEIGELTKSYLMLSGKARTKGKTLDEIQANFNEEVADVFCHILLLAKHYEVNLQKEIEDKWLAQLSEQNSISDFQSL
jgi:NTP pyrophosphatase (non-canonical NTP hydrolase)